MGDKAVKIYDNGTYREMTAEELAAIEDARKRAEAEERHRPFTFAEITEMVIRALINDLAADDATAYRMRDFYPEWKAGVEYKVGDRFAYNGKLYRCVQAHTSQEDWSPDSAASLWAKIGDPAAEYPEWSQPVGAHDAYSKGDKVSDGGKHWISTVDANIWKPGVYGWDEAE